MRSYHVRYSMRPQYTLSHRIVAQIKPKSPNRTCSEALTWRKQHHASSPLTNGAPPRRWSRPGVILSRRPRTQILQFVPINPLLFDYLSPQYLGFEILMGLVFWTLITCFGMGFAVFWYLGAF